METATYRSPDGPITGLFILVLGFGLISLPFWMTESDFLDARIRRGGGFLKLIEQTVGWEIFALLMVLMGLWFVSMGASALWKLLDSRPDLLAQHDRIDFHPAVRQDSVSYEAIDHWLLNFSSGHPVITIYFYENFWSLESKWPRKSMTLEGGKEDLEELIEYFSRHPYMASRFVR